MDDLLSRFFTAFRTLELTKARELLDEMECEDISEKIADRMVSVVLPIYYPADPGSSKLRFVIQCSAAAFLVKKVARVRSSVLDSLIEIYHRFPHVIGSSKPLKIVAEALTACDDFWSVFQAQTSECSVDFRWCLLLYCFGAGDGGADGWKAVESLMQSKETLASSRWVEILAFLARAVERWGPDAMISQMLIDYSLTLRIENDVPRFLYERASSPCGIPELVIDAMSLNLTQVNGQTARTLAMIVRNDGKFESKVFQLSLYLALIGRVPETYLAPLGQRLSKLVRENHLDPACAAHVVAIVSSSSLKGFSFFNDFWREYMGNSADQSRFFEYLADCAEFLNQANLVPVLTEVLDSAVGGCLTYGICKLMVSLLDTLSRHRELLPDPSILGNYVEQLMLAIGAANTKSSLTAAIDDPIPPAKVVAKIATLSGVNPCSMVTFNMASVGHAKTICAVTAYCLKYGSCPLQNVEHVAACMLIANVCGFDKIIGIYSHHASRVFGVSPFPPTDFSFDSRMSEVICDAINVSFREELVNRKQCIAIATEFLNYTRDSSTIRLLVDLLWKPSYLMFIPIDTLPIVVHKLTVLNGIEKLRPLFIAYMNESRSDFMPGLLRCFAEPGFRYWFISRVLSLAAAKSPTSLSVARNIDNPPLSDDEFTCLIPALLRVLPYREGPQSTRAGAMKLVASYPEKNPLLTQYVRDLATSILTESEKPPFPYELENEYGTFDPTELRANGVIGDNRSASSLETGASLYVLGQFLAAEETKASTILSKVHKNLSHSTDLRVRLSYLKFLGSIGTPGLPYAQQIAPMPTIPLL